MTGLYCFGRFTLDPAKRILCADGMQVPLGPTDLRLLLLLVESAGAIVGKDQLMTVLGGRSTRCAKPSATAASLVNRGVVIASWHPLSKASCVRRLNRPHRAQAIFLRYGQATGQRPD
jgi:hypothetical protein